MLSPLAEELNRRIELENPHLLETLSKMGKALYYPKGILTQTAEAKEKAHRYDATIGIARSKGKPIFLESVYSSFRDMSPGDLFPYAPSFGIKELREIWKEKILRDNPSLKGKDISLPLVTSGITHGLTLSGDLFLDPGDTVLVPDKVWGNYLLIYGIRFGAHVIRYPLLTREGRLDIQGFKQTVDDHASKGKLFILLNFPNNPTGYSPTALEAQSLSDCLIRTAEQGCNIVVVSDDSYFGLFYDETAHKESIFSSLAESHPRMISVKLDGATKEHFVWGFRTGFITYATRALHDSDAMYEIMEKKTAGAIRGAISNCSLPSQSILLKAMRNGNFESERTGAVSVLKERAMEVRRVLAQVKFEKVWEPYPFNSGYFMCVRLKSLNAEEFRQTLLNRYGVGVISTSDTDIRVAFSSLESSNIEDCFEIMYDCAMEMQEAKGTVEAHG